MVKQVKILSAKELVTSELRKAILTGQFKTGEELTQDKIAEMLGVSRMPVREAINTLASEGLIKTFPNRSAVVAEVPSNFIKEHFEVRILLECEAAARACEFMTEEQLQEIVELHVQHEKAIKEKKLELVKSTNELMHIAIWDAANNSKMKLFLTQLWNGLSTALINKALDKSHMEHEELIQAFKNRDKKKAKEAMKKHLESSMRSIIESKKNE
jgi:DNA-binding GntR family transcriptional regulator